MEFKDNWKKLVAWWAGNALANQRKISSGISWYLIIVISALSIPLISIVQGLPTSWSPFLVVFITATVGLLIMLIEAVFGKKEDPTITPIITTTNDG